MATSREIGKPLKVGLKSGRTAALQNLAENRSRRHPVHVHYGGRLPAARVESTHDSLMVTAAVL